MATTFVVPDAPAVTNLLNVVFGDGLAVANGSAEELADRHVATYVDDDDKLVAVGVCDKPFVAYSGAVLSMIPAGAANDMIKDDDISPSILDNFYEVMNICSRLLMTEKDSNHLRLAQCLSPDAGAAALDQLNGGGQRVAFDLKIPGYGAGQMAFVVT